MLFEDGMTPLREALAARPDDDFVISAPVRRRTPVKKQPKKISAAERVTTFRISLPRGTYRYGAARAEFGRRIEAKIAAGYFTDGSVPDEVMLAAVKGRGLE